VRRIDLALSGALVLAAFSACQTQQTQDARLAVFEKFNRASTFEEARPLVSGLLASQLDGLHARHPEQVSKVLNSLHLTAYQPRVVDVDDKTSFLVLEQVKSDTVKQSQQTYVLSRSDSRNWTLADRVQAETIVPALWMKQYAPAEFNHSSQCALSRKEAATNAPVWQSALAYRTKDKIEVRLLPFPISQADLDYLKTTQSGTLQSASAAQTSSLQQKHAECRVILVLGKSQRIGALNIGYDDPTLGTSTVFQGPGWATLPAQGAQTGAQSGLPSEFKNVQINRDRIAMETEGDLTSGDQKIRWSIKLDLPLWSQGL
jgi:hypothetical protein